MFVLYRFACVVKLLGSSTKLRFGVKPLAMGYFGLIEKQALQCKFGLTFILLSYFKVLTPTSDLRPSCLPGVFCQIVPHLFSHIFHWHFQLPACLYRPTRYRSTPIPKNLLDRRPMYRNNSSIYPLRSRYYRASIFNISNYFIIINLFIAGGSHTVFFCNE